MTMSIHGGLTPLEVFRGPARRLLYSYCTILQEFVQSYLPEFPEFPEFLAATDC